MNHDQVKRDLALYEKARLVYAHNARKMRDGECDRQAMAAAFLTIRRGFIKDTKLEAIN